MITTTQNAPLEKLLSYFRYKRTIDFIKNKKVLDFGCGISNWNSKFIGKYPDLNNLDERGDLIPNLYPNDLYGYIQKKIWG